MRLAILIASLLFPLMALGSPPDCRNAGLRPGVFSTKEWELVTSSSPSSDPWISEARFLLNRPDFSTDEIQRAVSITWPQAKRLILLGSVSRIYTKYPNEGLTLGTRSGKTYQTKVTGHDDLWKLTKLVDPCGVYILIVQP
jgi:hypothetical protein